MAAAYRREIEAADDPEAHREMIEQRLLRLRSPFRAAHDGDVVDLIDPRDTRRLACTFVKLAQPALHRLAQPTQACGAAVTGSRLGDAPLAVFRPLVDRG